MIKLKPLIESDFAPMSGGKIVLFVDMDGVLTDFDKQAQKMLGMAPDFEEKYGTQKFWSNITNAGVEFWSTMDWMPGGKKLWNMLEKYNPTILSVPSRHDSSKVGKRIWVQKHLGNPKIILDKDKYKYAAHNHILIDDRLKNISRWENAGGIGILHKSFEKTKAKLKKYGVK